VRLAALIALALTLAVACGGGTDAAEPPPTLPAEAVPGLVSRTRTLDATALAADSFAPDDLERVLEQAGYVGGSEREFTGRTETFDRVVARALRFASPEGADTYLAWLAGHAEEIVGQVEAEPALALGESNLLFSLVPCGSCKKELPTLLAAWRRDETVLFLLAAGRGASRESVSTLGRELDRLGG
jgi:hypothetical protein